MNITAFPAHLNQVPASKIDFEASDYIKEANADPDRIGKPCVMTFGDAKVPNMPPAAKGIFFLGTPSDHPGLVPLNPMHDFDNIVLDRLINFAITREWMIRKEYQARRGILIFGPKGTGKTTTIEQRCAQRGIPLYSITVAKDTMIDDLIQTRDVINGTTIWTPGVILRAFYEGVPLVINEADNLQPSQGIKLNEIVEKGRLVLPETGECVFAKRGFFVNITCNSAFTADHVGVQGAQPQAESLESRFWLCEVGYASVDSEAALLERLYPDLPAGIARQMASFADLTRKAASVEGGNSGVTLSKALSRRQLIDWGEQMLAFAYLDDEGVPVASYTLNQVYTATLSPEEKAGIEQLLGLSFA